MDDGCVVLCGASAYMQKYYFNKNFSRLPSSVQDELQILCVLFTEEIGGVLTLWFDCEGNLRFTTESEAADGLYDDIGSTLKIKEIQRTKRELLEKLELYYRAVFLGKQIDSESI